MNTLSKSDHPTAEEALDSLGADMRTKAKERLEAGSKGIGDTDELLMGTKKGTFTLTVNDDGVTASASKSLYGAGLDVTLTGTFVEVDGHNYSGKISSNKGGKKSFTDIACGEPVKAKLETSFTSNAKFSISVSNISQPLPPGTKLKLEYSAKY